MFFFTCLLILYPFGGFDFYLDFSADHCKRRRFQGFLEAGLLSVACRQGALFTFLPWRWLPEDRRFLEKYNSDVSVILHQC